MTEVMPCYKAGVFQHAEGGEAERTVQETDAGNAVYFIIGICCDGPVAGQFVGSFPQGLKPTFVFGPLRHD
jgi:hypothetical protein